MRQVLYLPDQHHAKTAISWTTPEENGREADAIKLGAEHSMKFVNC